MTYKISYPHKWDKNGYHYNQMVHVFATEQEIMRTNFRTSHLLEKKFDEDQELYFFNLTENRRVAEEFGYLADKRFLNRNTCVRLTCVWN